MIQAVYIISRSGLPIVVVDKGEESSSFADKALFSGIMTAIQSAMEEIDVGVPKFVDTRKFEVFIELSDEFAIALLKKAREDVERDLMHGITADLLKAIAKKYPDLHDANLLSQDQLTEIENFVDSMILEGNKELAQRKATKIVTDAFW